MQSQQQLQENFYTMASQIKLLLDIPERIWSAMEASQYLQATQLYLLCCHLHSLIQLEATTGGHYSPVVVRFPILVRQVATTGHFRLVSHIGKRISESQNLNHVDIFQDSSQFMSVLQCGVIFYLQSANLKTKWVESLKGITL